MTGILFPLGGVPPQHPLPTKDTNREREIMTPQRHEVGVGIEDNASGVWRAELLEIIKQHFKIRAEC
jgi:hypothetical protein